MSSSSNENDTPSGDDLDRRWERLVDAVDAARLHRLLEELGDDVDHLSKEEIQQLVRRKEEPDIPPQVATAPRSPSGPRRLLLRVGLPISLLALAAAGVTTFIFIQYSSWQPSA